MPNLGLSPRAGAFVVFQSYEARPLTPALSQRERERTAEPSAPRRVSGSLPSGRGSGRRSRVPPGACPVPSPSGRGSGRRSRVPPARVRFPPPAGEGADGGAECPPARVRFPPPAGEGADGGAECPPARVRFPPPAGEGADGGAECPPARVRFPPPAGEGADGGAECPRRVSGSLSLGSEAGLVLSLGEKEFEAAACVLSPLLGSGAGLVPSPWGEG